MRTQKIRYVEHFSRLTDDLKQTATNNNSETVTHLKVFIRSGRG